LPICIFAEADDLMPTYVSWLARRRELRTVWLSESTLGVDWSFAFDDRQAAVGNVEVGGERLAFEDLRGAYVNMNPQPALPHDLELPPVEAEAFLSARRNSVRHLIDSLPCLVANRLRAGRSNNSKPYQMRLLKEAGFLVPPWVVSNDPKAISEFAERCEDGVVCKSCSGLRSRVSRLDEAMLRRFDEGTTPVVAQAYIPGHDVRVHTVGDRAFATAILSHGIDYRFDTGPKAYRATSVPAPIEDLCHRFADGEEMIIAGFDFRVSEDGQWFCLEMNPVPTFLPYEMETGQPIGDALLDEITRR
jgi:glutathione synthase/RimK-type ligase-like ATP-grasp enzyme